MGYLREVADSLSWQESSKMSMRHLVRLESKEALLSDFTLYWSYLFGYGLPMGYELLESRDCVLSLESHNPDLSLLEVLHPTPYHKIKNSVAECSPLGRLHSPSFNSCYSFPRVVGNFLIADSLVHFGVQSYQRFLSCVLQWTQVKVMVVIWPPPRL